MRKIIPLSAAIFMVLICHSVYALETGTMMCRNGIVSIGETMPEVVNKCGPPSFTDRHEESRLVDDATLIITVDDWAYNFGPNEFMYSIRIENGRVKKIESLDYGY